MADYILKKKREEVFIDSKTEKISIDVSEFGNIPVYLYDDRGSPVIIDGHHKRKVCIINPAKKNVIISS